MKTSTSIFFVFFALLLGSFDSLEARSNRGRHTHTRTQRVERSRPQRTIIVRERTVRYRNRRYYGSRWGYGPAFGAGAYIGGWGGYDIPVRVREPEGKIKFDLKRVTKSEREQAKMADVIVDGANQGILDNVSSVVVDPAVVHEVEVRMQDGRTYRETVEIRDRKKVTLSPFFDPPTTEKKEKP